MGLIRKYDPDVTINVGCAAAVTEGRLYGIDSNGKAVVADRATGPQSASGVAVSTVTTAQASAGMNVALTPIAIIECTTSEIEGGAFTVGAPVYLHTTGFYTTTKPSAAASILQRVGTALSATKVYVNIAGHALTLQAAGNSTINA